MRPGSARPEQEVDGAQRLASPTRVATLLFALAFVASACGARVGPYLGEGAGSNGNGSSQSSPGTLGPSTADAQSGSPPSPGAAGAAGGGSSGGPSSNASSGAGAGSAGSGAPSAAGGQGGFSFDPRAEAAACPSSAGNTASDVGVAPNSVTIGNVSGLTGILPNNFNQGEQGVSALFAAINANGGICGRQLLLKTEDDQQNSSVNASDIADLIPKVFAFAGSTSDADNGGVPEMEQAGVPDFGFAIACSRSESPTYWSAAGGSCYQPQGPNGPYYLRNTYFKMAKQYGYLPSRMAFLSYNIAISSQAGKQFASMYQQLGGTICYTDYSISPASASLEADVVQMQNDNCGGVYTTLDVTGNVKMLQAMQQQDYHPSYVDTTFDGYTPTLIDQAGQVAVQGMTIGIPFAPLNEPNPVVQEYTKQLATYEPGAQPSGFGFLAWASTQLLVYALDQAGHNPTRAQVTKTLAAIQNWTSDGATGPYTPSSRSVATCGLDVIVKGNDFVRREPATSFYCGDMVQVQS